MEFGTLLECLGENRSASFESQAGDFDTSFLILESLDEDLKFM